MSSSNPFEGVSDEEIARIHSRTDDAGREKLAKKLESAGRKVPKGKKATPPRATQIKRRFK